MAEEPPVEALKAIAHPVRLRILQSLANGERNVGEIEEQSAIGQPALSQQLAVLRQAGLVGTRRDGKLVYYGVDNAVLAGVIACLSEIGGTQPDALSTQRTPSPGAANFARLS